MRGRRLHRPPLRTVGPPLGGFFMSEDHMDPEHQQTPESEEEVQQEPQTEEEKAEAAKQAELQFSEGFQRASGQSEPESTSDQDADKEKEKAEAEQREAEEAKAAEEARAEEAKAAEAKAAEEAERRKAQEPFEQLNQRLRNLEGKVGGWTDKLDKALAGAKAEAGTAAAPSEAQIAAAKQSTEKFDALKEEFPEWAEALEERLGVFEAALKGSGQEQPDVDQVRSEVLSEVDVRVSQAVSEARELGRLDARHPDWEQTINSEEFVAWSLEGGPSLEDYQAMKQLESEADATERVNDWARQYPEWWGNRGARIFSPKAADAIALLDAFGNKDGGGPDEDAKATEEAEQAAKEAEKRKAQEQRLRGAQTPKGAGGPTRTQETDEQQFERGFKRAIGR